MANSAIVHGKKIEIIFSSFFGSLKNMAQELDISVSGASKIKNGTQDIPPKAIKIVLTKYRVDPDWLFGTEPDEPIRYIGDAPANTKYYELLQKHAELQEELANFQREKIRKLEKS